MTEFIKGQWYVNSDGNYYQYLHENAYSMVFRNAGGEDDEWLNDITLESLTPARLTPDFTNARVGDEAFSCVAGVGKMDKMEYGIARFTFADKSYAECSLSEINYLYKNGIDSHPTLFNSFAQFMAYWAEQWLSYTKDGDHIVDANKKDGDK